MHNACTMSNIATALKAEIARIARKELRSETEALKKSSSRYRSDIAALKKQLTDLERQLGHLGKHSQGARSARAHLAANEDSGGQGLRFRAPGLASHRQRLGLSAREAGQIMGVSALTVYNWEAGKSRPRRTQMPAIAAFRRLGKREALAALGG